MAIFDFGYLQGVNLSPSWTKTQTLSTVKILCKNLSFLKSFKWHLYNYEDYMWSKYQLSLMLFTGVIPPKRPKMDQLGPEPK